MNKNYLKHQFCIISLSITLVGCSTSTNKDMQAEYQAQQVQSRDQVAKISQEEIFEKEINCIKNEQNIASFYLENFSDFSFIVNKVRENDTAHPIQSVNLFDGCGDSSSEKYTLFVFANKTGDEWFVRNAAKREDYILARGYFGDKKLFANVLDGDSDLFKVNNSIEIMNLAMIPLVNHHIVRGFLNESEIIDGLKVVSISGDVLQFSNSGESLSLRHLNSGNTTNITGQSYYTDNVAMHVVDGTLVSWFNN